MRFDVCTLYTDIIGEFARTGVVGRAVSQGILHINAVNIRDYATDVYRSVDDYPYGGGAGMVMKPGPVCSCIRDVKGNRDAKVVFFSPRGVPLTSSIARQWAAQPEVILLCGHFEGVDERAVMQCVDEEISVGDYILTGGHIAAMCFMDAVARYVPGVLGNAASSGEESFEDGLLEHEQFTRPRVFEGIEVPSVLLSGNHRLIYEHNRERSLVLTRARRPDLLDGTSPPDQG